MLSTRGHILHFNIFYKKTAQVSGGVQGVNWAGVRKSDGLAVVDQSQKAELPVQAGQLARSAEPGGNFHLLLGGHFGLGLGQ